MNHVNPWSLGMVAHAAELSRRAEGKEGLAAVVARLEHLNYVYAWLPGEANRRRSEMVNRSLYRIKALYSGGDCYLGGFPGAEPWERLWQYRLPRPERRPVAIPARERAA